MKKIIIFILIIAFSLEELKNASNISDTKKISYKYQSINISKSINLTKEANTTQKLNLNKKRFHYEDCSSNSDCKKNFFCNQKRCLTKFEINHLKDLGLNDSNICISKTQCQSNKKCIKHRCVKSEKELYLPRKANKNDTSINLLFAGSIFLNGKAYQSGEMSNGTFNYDHFFKNIKRLIKKADLAVVDQETIFQTNKTQFKKCVGNTPTELGDAIANAGFKLVLHGTIYAYSKKSQGIKNTLDYWENNHPKVKVIGISRSKKESETDYYIFKKNKIKIGIINFSGFKNLIPQEKEYFVNVINKTKIQKMMNKLKNETDFIIACMNWGEKNSSAPNKNQIKIAKELVENGVQLIIGNRPSMVHTVSYIKSKGKTALVFWSLGHLISDSAKINSYIGALANITISKGKGKGFISNYNFIPIINHKGNSTNYTIYKLSQYSQELGLEISSNFSMENVTKECKKLMGNFIE